MPSPVSQLLVAAIALGAAVGVSAEPRTVINAPAKNEAPRRIEAAMFDMDVNLADVGQLEGLLLQTGVDQAEATAVSALAQTAADERVPLRVKLGLSRDPDSGAIAVQRLRLSTAEAQTVIEQRGGKLRVVSTAPRKLRTV